MESIIKWQTGTPSHNGNYLVSYRKSDDNLLVTTALFRMGHIWISGDWKEVDENQVVAWCKLSDIKPYKGE